MLTFLKSYWMPIAGVVVFALVTLGTAFYMVHSATQENQAARAKLGAELKAASELADKSKVELEQAKLGWSQEKALETGLKNKLAESEKRVSDLQASVEKISQDLANAVKSKRVPAKTSVGTAVRCKETDTRASREQLRQLEDLQADLYRRDAELREGQKKLDQARSEMDAERRKLDLDKTEYRWPHNGSKGTK